MEKEQKSPLSSREALKSYEGWAWWVFALSTALTAFGPIIHYAGWPLALLLLLLQRLQRKTSLTVALPAEGRFIMGAAVALVLWTAASTILTSNGVKDWGHGVSYFIEMAFGLWLASRLSQHERDRRVLLRVIVWGAVVSALFFTLQELSIVAGINKSLSNGNSLGLLGLLVSLFLWVQSLSSDRLSFWGNSLLFTLGGSVLFLSFSSGAWGAGALQIFLILQYLLRRRRTARWIVLSSLVLALVGLAGVDYYSEGRTKQLMFRELSQMVSLGDLDSLTTHRKDIWLVSLGLIKEHPVTGYGQRFEMAYMDYVARHGLKVTPMQTSHPHNTWLFVLYRSGIPGLLIFILLVCALMRKSWRLMKFLSDVDRRWAVASSAFLAGQIFYSTNGDIFQGRRDVAVIAWALFGIVAVLPVLKEEQRSEKR